MSKAETLLNYLLKAGKGANSAERQAQARVRTNGFFDLDKHELKAAGLMAEVKQMEDDVEALRAAAVAAGDVVMAEVYAASLTVFVKWTSAKDAA
ncbi:hypothetical protein CCC_03181 [Paramagnetospirillum magnetotacticum MS-1]|uniref:Uncharacterized protein n=1 Tax=Paramagnetospirillum magnetotacticum MS-1 TaxID=272627 RepID=A0A0C2YZR6_PARME|nr:hypothetical protein [Paramagnetospirillum magnetotacticum]KIM00579.1 hypothetical protein CCC_03181 [Paramagnetospirillum magnetotacticum MS-1]